MTYHPIEDPELSMEKIYASLPSTWFMMKQIVTTYVLASDTGDNLDGLHVLQVIKSSSFFYWQNSKNFVFDERFLVLDYRY